MNFLFSREKFRLLLFDPIVISLGIRDSRKVFLGVPTMPTMHLRVQQRISGN